MENVNEDRTQSQLVEELAELRQRIAELEEAETQRHQAELALQRRNRELALLNLAAQAINSTLALDQVLSTLLEEIRHLMNVVACSVWLIVPETDELVCCQAAGPRSDVVRGWRLSPGQGIAGWTVCSGRSIVVSDTHADEHYFAGVDHATGFALRSILSVPLRAKETAIGVIQAVDTRVDWFGQEDLNLLQALASAAAIAIENARLHEQTRELAAFSENIIQSMQEGILLEDASGEIIFVNPSGAAILGYAPDELIGRHWSIAVAPECVGQVEQESRQRPHGVLSRYETVLLTRTGQRLPVIVSARPLFDGDDFSGVLSLFIDITELKRAKQALRESEEKYRLLVENASEAITLVNTDGCFLIMNNAAAQRLGGRPQDYIGQTIWDVMPPDAAEEQMTAIRTTVQTGEGSVSELKIPFQDGTRWFQSSTQPIKNSAGQVVAVLNLSTDITEHKRMEQYLLHTERLAVMGRISAILAHEIKNPLQTIGSHLELVLDFALSPQQREEYLRFCQQEVEHLTEITARMLDSSRPVESEPTPTPIAQVVQRALALARQPLRAARVQVATELPYNLPPALILPDRTAQVLLNLFINAAEAMPDGGNVHLTAHAEQEDLVLTLTNDGPAISPDHVEHIFDPFFTTKPDSAGLGLFISHAIIEQQGGSIHMENCADGTGVVFTITLPIA
ncbi:MAG TPA: PAS domain S-box protein [Chloroflexi bacterium]|nr:PAS domain S-box protein [Chloroflexota bacterium]